MFNHIRKVESIESSIESINEDLEELTDIIVGDEEELEEEAEEEGTVNKNKI